MDYTKLASTIDGAVKDQIGRIAAHIRLGTVKTVSANTVSVLLDGSILPATMTKGCSCVAGDRVIVLRQGTQFYCMARVGG